MSTIIILCCLFAIYEAVLGFLQVIGLQTSGNVNYLITGSFSNPGPFGGVLAIMIAILGAFSFGAVRRPPPFCWFRLCYAAAIFVVLLPSFYRPFAVFLP